MGRDLGEHWCPNCGPIGTCRCEKPKRVTADRAELVEKMDDAYWQAGEDYSPVERMSAALDLALEEAAKVAEGRDWEQPMMTMPSEVSDAIAAAIRALKGGA